MMMSQMDKFYIQEFLRYQVLRRNLWITGTIDNQNDTNKMPLFKPKDLFRINFQSSKVAEMTSLDVH